ncbi:MAG: hypothetical protein K0R16_1934 [Nitrososphaeraceae archaeon]|jgi:hypothetical protein|nr:hypothetical protein [Nitrososphaeraceae archaeon]MDF2770234.1 hypothetical protein [Nitrososphaeraceae archaeon]
MSKKVKNIRRKSNVYFSIDDENFPYKGIKGKKVGNYSARLQENFFDNSREDKLFEVPWHT